MALRDRRVLVLYDVGGPDLWHERLVLYHIENEDYVVATPDMDVHYEELSIVNPDLKGIRVKPVRGGYPPGIAAHQVYPMPALNGAQMAALKNTGLQVLQSEQASRGVGAQQPRGAADAAPVGSPEAVKFQAGTLYWVAADSAGDFRYGDHISAVSQPLVKGSKFVHSISGVGEIFVECIDGGERAQHLQKPASWDHRVLGQEIDALGKPDCSLKDVAKKAKEHEVSWVLTGPRTTKWCVSYLVVEGLGLEGHHERFRQLAKVDAASWGVQEHFQLSMIIKHAMQVDQINAYNNMFCEVIFRRLQTIEYAYAEKVRDAESKSVGGRLSVEEQQTFGGLTRQAGTLMICPELLDYVKGEVERDASLAKNMRKAREERELARKQGKKKGDDAAP